jgi:hypothetical protein
MYEFNEGAKLSKNFYEPEKITIVDGVYVVKTEEKNRLEKQQEKLYWKPVLKPGI